MILSILVASALLNGNCEAYVDDDYIREANEVFLGVVLPREPADSEGLTRVVVIAVLGGRNLGSGSVRELEINSDDRYIWSNISSAIIHNDEGFIESGYYSSSSSYEGCYVTVHVMPQVMYLFVQGDGWRRRSIEPVLVPHTDEWVTYVQGVLQP